MAAVTHLDKNVTEPDDDPEDRLPAAAGGERSGFFTVYKRGQGIYTRYGTAFCAVLLIVLLGLFVYEQGYAVLQGAFYTAQTAPPNATPEQTAAVNAANVVGQQHSVEVARYVTAGLTAAVVLIGSVVGWRLMNAPRSVNFLIATDSEMKKVNWTSREELFGSTRVVILFLFAIAGVLFLIDVVTGLIFQLIGLLKFGLLS